MSKRALYLLTVAAALLVVGFAGCNSTNLDDGDSADVVLEVNTMTGSPITSQPDNLTGGCVFTIQDWSATLANKPKNSLAVTSPFNDIRLIALDISYAWANPAVAGVTNPRTFAMAGTIPANGTASVTFTPIALGDLDLSKEGQTADLVMVFRGRTVDGFDVSAPVYGKQLNVNSCIQTNPGGP